MNETVEPEVTRTPLESIAELSASALLPLEPSVIETLARYEDCPADPTIRMLPDFSVVEDSPTLPRALAKPLELQTMLPPPPKPPSLPPLPRAPTVQKKKAKRRSLPPIAPLPEKPAPLELPRKVPVLEWAIARAPVPQLDANEDDERTSVLPVTKVVTPMSRKRPHYGVMAAGAAFGLVALALTYHALEPKAAAAQVSRRDALLVTVAGAGGTSVDRAQVFIDGVRRCDSSPCLVSDLPEGLHFVTVTAPEHATTSPRVVKVSEREPALLHVELAREEAPPALSPLPTPVPAPAPAPPPALLPLPEPNVAPAAPIAPRPSIPRVERGTGFLNLNSIPASAVVLDGQPIGRTPRMNVAVKPGPHVVVFVHPEQGRRAQSVVTEAGATQTVAVRF